MSATIKTPFPWFGGKSKAAPLLWERVGTDCGNYIEPFFGSGAVWLNRPADYSGWATVNDLDGNVANFWRAMATAPDEVAEAALWHVSECDLHARHLWLVTNLPKLAPRLMADPDYCEPRTAGWWAWGACLWIGGGWCSGEGPWHAEPDAEGVPALFPGNGGQGVKRKLPHLGDGGKGVKRQLPHLGDGGTGVNRQLPHLGNGGSGVIDARREWLQDWFRQLQDRLAETRIVCGDWERICSVGSMTRNGIAAVLMDPPYSLTEAVYTHDSSTVSGDVRRWCIANGNNPKLRIALCGHDTEHNELETLGWRVETWDKGGGYQGADDRERIWFSPACKFPARNTQQELFT
jgi:hypothetical protein